MAKKKYVWLRFEAWAKDNDIYDYTDAKFFKEFKKIFGLKTKRSGKTKESYYDGIREVETTPIGVEI